MRITALWSFRIQSHAVTQVLVVDGVNPYSMVTGLALEGIPLATTTSALGPVSIVVGTTKVAETTALPVAIPMVLKFDVRA